MQKAQAWWNKISGMKFVRDAGALTTSQVTMAILMFAQGVLVARWLGPEQFGVAALIISYPSLLFSIFDARANAATVKFVSEFSAHNDSRAALAMCKLSYGVEVAIALLTLLLVGATAWWAEAHIVHTPGTAPLMLLYAAAFVPRGLAGTSRAVLSVLGRFQGMAWAEFGSKLLSVIVTLGLVASGWGVTGVIIGGMVDLVVSGIALAVLAFPRITRRWGATWLSASWRELGGRGREIFNFLVLTELTELAGLLGKQADILILGFFAGPLQAGYYRLGKKLTGVVGLLVQPLQSVLYPRLAALWGASRYPEFLRTIRRYTLWIGLPIGTLACLGLPFVPPIINLVVGAEYMPAAPVTQLLVATAAVWLAFSWFRPVFHATGSMKFLMINTAAVNAVCVIGYLIAAPRWGAVGIAAVWFIMGLVSHAAWWTYYRLALQSKLAPRTVEIAADIESPAPRVAVEKAS